MLKSLLIKNYALIEELEINFSNGFSVITGETGAGKSILLGALNTVLGDRINSDLAKNNTQNCVIEAVFDISKSDLPVPTETVDNELVLRRIITPAGKSRSFINDEPANLSVLKNIRPALIDIHSQHQNLLVHESDFQLFVIDCLAETEPDLAEYQKLFTTWKSCQKSLVEWQEKLAEAEKNKDYWQFQVNELEELNLQENELESLEKMQIQKESLVELQSFSAQAQAINSGETVSEILANIQTFEAKFVKIFPEKKELFERLENLKLELEALGEDFGAAVDFEENFDATQLANVEDRLSQIQRIQEKHRLNSEAEIFEFMADLSEKLAKISETENEVLRLEKLQKSLYDGVIKCGKVLSKKRQTVFGDLKFSLEKSLKDLGIPFIQFAVENKILSEPTQKGIDSIEFLFAANKGAQLSKLSDTASGGEISRIMLVLKLLIANKRALPSIIFDEIDTGISGAVAETVGNLLHSISAHAQVFAITHLPQVASKGDTHLVVEKNHEGEKTQSHLREISETERVNVIAQMLSGSTVTESAKEHAQQLLF